MNFDSVLLEHMMEPKNYGELLSHNSEGIGKNPQNGEKVIVFLDVKGSEPKIEDISFQAIGCMTTVTAGSIITSEAKGLTFKRAQDLIATTLGILDNVPPEEAACSEMVALALKAAMDTYMERRKDCTFPVISYKIQNSCYSDNNIYSEVLGDD
jgi:nitrogen fixation NifU-like protein